MTCRLPAGGRIDRGAPLRFTLDGTELTGYRGDTVASAMLASGTVEVGPSIYRRRPRGVFTADVTEPNALLQVDGRCSEPMLPATTTELFDGMAARTLSGVGRLDPAPDPAVYDKKYVHTDVLVVGAGPAGLAAALAASAGGARVMLVDDQPEPGGQLLSGADRTALDWVASARATLAGRPEVRVLARSTALRRDGGYLLVAERRTDHLGPAAPEQVSRQRLWHVRARRVVLATGAHERPLVFADNDRPGVMLAGAVRTYLNRYAVLPGGRAVVVTTNDSAYDTALELAAHGAEVAALLDTRPNPPAGLVGAAERAGIPVRADSVVNGTAGERRITAVRVGPRGEPGPAQWLDADLLAVSGGWNPAVHLYPRSPGELRWEDELAAFVPVPGDHATNAISVVGAAAGTLDLAGCLAGGARAGVSAAATVGYPGAAPELPDVASRPVAPVGPVWLVPGESGDPASWRDHFVDLQRDVTVADVWRATGAGMRSVEHVKRYTTVGTGHDQGRTSGVLASGVIATALGLGSPGELGTTTFRPPYTPVSFALLAGRDRAELLDPVRVTSIHPWHQAAGAEFENVGRWKRPRYYPRPGEDMRAAVLRECRAARTGVCLQDASTLGKIDVVGRDAGRFLNRIYTNAFAKLKVGSARYGMMCTADGMVFDDGVVVRLAEDHFYLTTTTGNAAAVLDWLEEWSQTEWPELDVTFTSVTEQWATIAVVGPRSRAVVARLAPLLDCANEAFGFMTVRETTLGIGVPARIARVSFSGELAYEVNVASWHGLATWEAVLAAGEEFGITPYGTETMHVLRAEKGFPIVGQDTDGTVTPEDLGMSWIVSTRKDFVGRRSLSRPDSVRADRKHLVGLLPAEPDELLPEGAQLVAEGVPISPDRAPVPMLGHVTSSYHSAALRRTFALALVRGGRDRIGQRVLAPLGDRVIAATVTEPVFYDREGARRDG